jgi:hypothetical protein
MAAAAAKARLRVINTGFSFVVAVFGNRQHSLPQMPGLSARIICSLPALQSKLQSVQNQLVPMQPAL